LTLGALHAVADAPAGAEPPIGASGRGRLPLAIVVALGSGLLTVGLTTGELVPTVALSVIGLVMGLWAFRRLTPPGTLSARPVLPAAILLRGILTCAFFSVDAFVALTLVGWRGLSATEAGFALTAATISWTAGSWAQARGATRWPTRRFVRVGFVVVTLGLSGMLLVLRQDISWLAAIGAFSVAGFGMGLAYSPLALIVLREAPPETHGTATSSLSLTESLGTAFGTGLSGALVAASVRTTGNPAAGLAVAFTTATVIGLGGVALSGRLRPREVPAGSFALTSGSPPT
jgi:predicted MFS family arabinose efflux permease